jgi:hypothetical protein
VSTSSGRTRRPSGLGPAGAALWRAVTSISRGGHVLELRADELTTLALACKTADTIAALEAVLDGQDLVVAGSKGQVSVHPAVAELRLQRNAQATLLRYLAIPDSVDTSWDDLTASQRGRRAAHARWS